MVALSLEKGFGFSTEAFDKELKVDKSERSASSFEWSSGTEKSLFKILRTEDEDGNYKPLFGAEIQDIVDIKITKVYVKDSSNWKKVKSENDISAKQKVQDVVKVESKGTWTPSA